MATPISDPSFTSSIMSSPQPSASFCDDTSSSSTSLPNLSSPASLPLTMSTPTTSTPRERNQSTSDISWRKYSTAHNRLLFRYAKQEESEVVRIGASYEKVRRKVKMIMATENRELSVVDFLKSVMKKDAALFLSSRLRGSKKKSKGKRWTIEEKILALSIYKQSHKFYHFLRRIIALPCTLTLKSILHTLPFSTGIDNQALSTISHYLNQGDACDRMCVLMFDEMSLKPHLEYQAQSDLIVGFEDHGHLGRNSKCAKYALVFMVRGLLQKWKQPISVYFSSSPTKPEVLVTLMEEVLRQCQNAGLCVTVIVCDMGTNNVKALNSMGSSLEKPSILFEGKEIVTIFDPPHLLKSTRNLLMKHNIKLQVNTESLQFEGVASWKDIQNAYKKDKEQMYKFRRLYKLTKAHINPKGRRKMQVLLAAEVLSQKAASYLMCGVTNGYLPQEAIGTAHFVQKVDVIFDSVNGRIEREPIGWKGPVTRSSGHARFWEEAREQVKSWRLCEQKGQLLQPPFKGWLTTLRGMRLVWDKIKSARRGGKLIGQFCPRHVNLDALENLFGCLRALGGSNRDPTVSGFMDSWKTCIINGLAIDDFLKGRNCQPDGASLLSTHNPNLEDAGAPLQDLAVTSEAAAVSVSVGPANLSCNSTAEVCRNLAKDSFVYSSCGECRNGLWSTSPSEWTLPTDLGDQQQLFPSETLMSSVADSLNFCQLSLDRSTSQKELFICLRKALKREQCFKWAESICVQHGRKIRKVLESELAFIAIENWCCDFNRNFTSEKRCKEVV